MRKKYFVPLTTLIIIFIINITASFSQKLKSRSPNKLIGTISDINGSRVSNANVTIKGKEMVRTEKASEDGEYEFVLSPGVYQIEVGKAGFCTARRAPFIITSTTDARLNFTLASCPIVNSISIKNNKYEGETDYYQLPFKEEILPIIINKQKMSVLFQFNERSVEKNTIKYKGIKDGNSFSKVMVSFNLLTILANEIIYDKSDNSIKANGDVTIDDGKKSIHVESIEIKITSIEPPIKLIR